jgi:hypothetical protein
MDNESGKTRGFGLISKQNVSNSNLCRVGHDYISSHNFVD